MMKKIILIIGLIIGFQHKIISQQIYLIPKGGVSISSVKYVPAPFSTQLVEDYNYAKKGSIHSYTGGVGIEIGLMKKNIISIQPEILYVRKGARIFHAAFNEDYQLNYLEIPLLLKFIYSIKKFKFFVNAGPSIGIGLDGKYKYLPSSNLSKPFDKDIEFTDHSSKVEFLILEKTDVSMNYGGGVGYKLGKLVVWLEGRYGKGSKETKCFYNYQTTGGVPKFPPDWTFYNRFITITMGIAIPLKNI